MAFVLSSIVSMLALATAAPVVSPLAPRAPCAPENMGYGIDRYDCPHQNTLDDAGHCSAAIPNIPGNQGCSAYCEVRLTVFYGTEVPYSQSACEAGSTCTVSVGTTVTVTNGYTVTLGGVAGFKRSEVDIEGRNLTLRPRDDEASELTASFNLGASYSYSKSVAYTTTTLQSKVLTATQCGYWTFIPYVMSSCGTLTVASETGTYAGYEGDGTESFACNKGKNDYTDTGNWCNVTPYAIPDSNGHTDGENVFVYTDCNPPFALLPPAAQDPKYNEPGVSSGKAPGT